MSKVFFNYFEGLDKIKLKIVSFEKIKEKFREMVGTYGFRHMIHPDINTKLN